MRIAHILWSLGTGGTENMVVDIASVQANTEEIGIFVINDWVEEYMLERLNPNCEVFLYRRKPGSKNPIPWLKFNYDLLKFSPDIVHHHASRSIYCQKVCNEVPKVRTIHSLDNTAEEYSNFDQLFSISNSVKSLTEKQGFDSITIWNGIKTEGISRERKQLFEDNRLHFVQVSRLLTKFKGQDVVVKAMKILKDKGYGDVLQMHFIGDGQSEDELKLLSKKLGVEDMIIFEGRCTQQEIYEKLASFDLLIQASRREGFGLTIAEGMIARIPVLVSNIDAMMEVIGNGKYGYYFNNESPEDLAMKIEKYIANDDAVQIVNDAYNFAMENYNVKATARKYIDEYRKVLKAHEKH